MKSRSDRTLLRELREFVSAIDRRLPRVGHDGENAVARDAQDLRREALARIAEVEAADNNGR